LRDDGGAPVITICVNGYRAFELGLIDLKEYYAMTEHMRDQLRQHGYEPLNLKGDHLLLSLDPDGNMERDEEGNLDTVLCNFEQVRAPWMDY